MTELEWIEKMILLGKIETLEYRVHLLERYMVELYSALERNSILPMSFEEFNRKSKGL